MPVIAPGIRGQTQLDDLLDFGGVITVGGTPQLVLPQQPRRLSLFIANTDTIDTYTVGLGPPPAVATIANGSVTAIAMTNAGLGYSIPPKVRILGGVVNGDYQNAPSRPAAAHPVMSGVAPNMTIASIVVDDPGAGYNVAPLIYLENPLPNLGGGATIPSATAGIPLPPGWNLSFSGMILVPTSALSIFGPNTGKGFACKIGGLV